MSKKDIKLNIAEVDEIKTLADGVRRIFGVHRNAPIAGDIKKLIEKRDILICEYPFSDYKESKTYANLTVITIDKDEYYYIGLNTSIRYDKQLFALAHELYHIKTKTGLAYSFDADKEDERIEKKADRFAAELLLPEEELKHLVVTEFGKDSIDNDLNNRLLRFIATLQCEWWLPYKAIVNRLFEENYITKELYEELYAVDSRAENGLYFTILRALDENVAVLLNRKTKNIGISNKAIECVIKNYEDGYIDDDEFAEVLALYNKTPEDYGFSLLDNTEVDEDLADFVDGGN